MRLFEGTQWDQPPTCERCNKLEEDCNCPPPPQQFRPPEKQTARLQVEKRKRGKVVTVIRGLHPNESDLPTLLKKLKSATGAGGSIQNDSLEIQGAHIERIKKQLQEIGYRVK